MSSDWDAKVHRAAADYATVAGAAVVLAEREAAARRFRAHIVDFAAGGKAALDALECALPSEPWWRGAAAARALSAIDAPAAIARVVTAATGPLWIGMEAALARLGRARSIAAVSLPQLELGATQFRAALARARFSRAPKEAEDLIATLPAGPADVALVPAVDCLADRGILEPLRVFVVAPPAPPPVHLPVDIASDVARPHAAFRLALTGDSSGLAALLSFARDDDIFRAANSAVRLGYLAHPDGVAPTAALLARAEGFARGLTFDTCLSYATTALAPALMALLEAHLDDITPEVDQALLVLAQIAGFSMESLETNPSAIDVVYTRGSRQAALLRCRTALFDLEAALRYRDGHPLTLSSLAEDLASLHQGLSTTAAWNLRAITGQDFGYDADDDLIANIDAIDAWRAQARGSALMAPGGWAFLGGPLPPPVMP